MTDSNPKNERQRGNKIVQQFGQLSTAEKPANGVDTLFAGFSFSLGLCLVLAKIGLRTLSGHYQTLCLETSSGGSLSPARVLLPSLMP